MRRVLVQPRPNWQERLDKIGFYYHSIDGNYWQEDACYVFNLAQIETLESATQQLHEMYLEACAKIIKNGDFDRLAINDLQATLIEQSWKRQDPTLYGRFDLCYDGINPPKLYEYNADTPTSLFESSVAQWYWLKEQQPHNLPSNADQFNSIHERLLTQWQVIAQHYSRAHPLDKKIAGKLNNLTNKLPFAETINQAFNWYEWVLHLTAVADCEEDFITCRYVQDTAIQAGLTTEFIDIHDIGWHSEGQYFVDEQNNCIHNLFKLYPWEFLTNEEFGSHLAQNPINWIEPAWKLLLSNKAILPILWEMFPNHPNLLPCYFNAEQLRHELGQTTFKDFVKKPIFSREGANISLNHAGESQSTQGEYGAEGYVYQACQPLPKFTNQRGEARFTLVGSWVVGHCPAGIGIREDFTLITKDTSLFVPHYFID